jgi:hypothetical protein
MKITKEQFVSSIEAIKEQYENDEKITKALNIIQPDSFNSFNGGSVLVTHLIKLLEDFTNDKNSWIEYFIYELDFGVKYKEGCATYKDKTPIDLSNAGTLYEFLKSENE